MALSSPNNFDTEGRSLEESRPASASVPNLALTPDQLDSDEFSAPLETLVPLEAPRSIARVLLHSPVAVQPDHQVSVQPIEPQAVEPQAVESQAVKPQAVEPVSNSSTPVANVQLGQQPKPIATLSASSNLVDEALIPLLEERLVIDRHKRKVGEVVVRKEIETHIIEVPVRREKLIVEQISPTYEQLAVINLGQTQSYDNLLDASLPPMVSAKFTTAHAAIEFLNAIVARSNAGVATVQVSLVLTDETLQAAYQQWLEQHSNEANAL